MRLKLARVKGVKQCDVKLPANSVFKMSMNKVDQELNPYLPLKIVFEDQVIFVGYSGGDSEEENTIEIAEDFAKVINLPEGASVEVSIQYTFSYLKKVEFEPLTPDDYDIVVHFQEYIEWNLFNQIGVLYDGLIFPCYVGANQQYKILFKVNIKDKITERTECFMLNKGAEADIPPKLRDTDEFKRKEEIKHQQQKEHKNKVISCVIL
jgi:peroxin-1